MLKPYAGPTKGVITWISRKAGFKVPSPSVSLPENALPLSGRTSGMSAIDSGDSRIALGCTMWASWNQGGQKEYKKP